jgi:hypothetical protein
MADGFNRKREGRGKEEGRKREGRGFFLTSIRAISSGAMVR